MSLLAIGRLAEGGIFRSVRGSHSLLLLLPMIQVVINGIGQKETLLVRGFVVFRVVFSFSSFA